MPAPISEETWHHYFELRQYGWSQSRAAKAVGISRTSASAKERNLPASGEQLKAKRDEDTVPEPRSWEELPDNAKRAVEDFDFFRKHYLGRDPIPWQRVAAEQVVALLESDEDEFVVINVPPGSGKSTTFTHDIPAWLVLRDRTIRQLIGSRTMSQARKYVGRLRRTFERPTPMEGAEGTLRDDFGRFKPEHQDLWRSDEFIVDQVGGVAIGEKESTITAAGQDTGFLGGRFDFVIWDDLVDRKNTRTQEMRDQLQEDFDQEMETRLEPGGVFILQGQRISPKDLYRYALDKRLGQLGAPDEDDEAEAEGEPKYRHIIFPAHFDDLCEGAHERSSPAWPEDGACLLDPVKLSHRKLAAAKENNPRTFEISYQQKDVDPEGQLVREVWLDGGPDHDGSLRPGCYDHDRDICQLPDDLDGPLISLATADPSPTKFWAIQWWVYDQATDRRFLMDQERKRMDAPDLLDEIKAWHHTGLAEEWQVRSIQLGIPITHWIVENNAAQRFLLQYRFVQRWMQKHSVSVVPHHTGVNKADEELGVQMIAPQYMHGRVRIPWKIGYGRRNSEPLVKELTTWPEGSSDDCVMANWFMEYHLQNLKVEMLEAPKMARPSWMARRRDPVMA